MGLWKGMLVSWGYSYRQVKSFFIKEMVYLFHILLAARWNIRWGSRGNPRNMVVG